MLSSLYQLISIIVNEEQHSKLSTQQGSRLHLLQEPVAAALAYGIDGGTDGETVLVFELVVGRLISQFYKRLKGLCKSWQLLEIVDSAAMILILYLPNGYYKSRATYY